MNLEILNQTFDVAESPGIDTLDPRWAELTGLVQDGDFAAAGAQAESLLREGIFDIRIICYLGFGVFMDHGVLCLGELAAGMTRTLSANWPAVGPEHKREAMARTSFVWMLKQMLKKLQREEQAQGDTWQRWIDGASHEEIDGALEAIRAWQGATNDALGEEAAAVNDGLAKLRQWVSSFRNAVPAPQAPEPEEEEPQQDEAAAGAAEGTPTPATGVAAQGSHELQVLLKKLEVFQGLVAEEKYLLARIVADDVYEILSNFDPMRFFPGLFSVFARLMAMHATTMSQYDAERDTPEWMALQSLYRVDIDEFRKF